MSDQPTEPTEDEMRRLTERADHEPTTDEQED